jgi:hypothetical protein
MDAGCPGLVAATPQDLGDPGGGQGRSPGPEPEAVQAGQLVACARQEYRVTGFHDGFQLMHPYQTVSVHSAAGAPATSRHIGVSVAVIPHR